MSLDPFDTEAGLRTEDQSMESLDTIIRDGESPQLEVGNISLDAPRQDLLNSIFNGPNRFPDVPPAFDEDPIIRDVYIDVFLAASFDHVSRAEAQRMLSSANRTLVAMSKRFGNELRGLGEMARTLPDVQRRLGFDSGQHVVYYFVCDICWSRYHPSQLYRLETSECTQPGCSGVLFVTKESGGRTDRIPVKVLPVASQLES
ncbi:uncharacterized protein C8Q71DRAFT_856575 [Rhodofomes roseus]|uniref:Uncharacterized protein n=1 Tax=Rhodofomes roseus TaxID=34475 RepID=A0A4Y9Y1I0_9APHY|nr:uncharacterized protein C8Q71DRAFT_856575 [Rhodofomes roseus]KAH9838642.1 hypothetical protein C8Q71DRAFT_856575 [Rhodofomes roseus]TFY56215.1 hypothetical protein EVJ58_g7771 [Rhodofomes roseus]